MSKWSPEILAKVHPNYRLRDDGRIEHATTGVLRPRMDSQEASVFRDGQKGMLVDAGCGWMPDGWKVGDVFTIRVFPCDDGFVRVNIGGNTLEAFMPGRFDPIE
jgi:hypothetical protein